MIRIAILSAALAAGGCALLEPPPPPSPAETAARIERQRQASLPISQASCPELTRRVQAAEQVIEEELRLQECRERVRADPEALIFECPSRFTMPQPRSTERDRATIAAVVAEQAQRCGS